MYHSAQGSTDIVDSVRLCYAFGADRDGNQATVLSVTHEAAPV